MEQVPDLRVPGVLAVAATTTSLAALPLYFLGAQPPEDGAVLTRVLLGSVGGTVLLVFFAAWGSVVRAVAPDLPWLAGAVVTAGAVWIALTFVHLAMEAGAVIAAPSPIDPTVEGPYAPAQFLLQGSAGRLLSAVVVLGSALAVRRARLGPPWLAASGLAVAVVQVVFVPSLYLGADPSRVASAVGWGTTALAPGLAASWLLLLGLQLLRSGRRAGTR